MMTLPSAPGLFSVGADCCYIITAYMQTAVSLENSLFSTGMSGILGGALT